MSLPASCLLNGRVHPAFLFTLNTIARGGFEVLAMPLPSEHRNRMKLWLH